jgi:hypothetical protein
LLLAALIQSLTSQGIPIYAEWRSIRRMAKPHYLLPLRELEAKNWERLLYQGSESIVMRFAPNLRNNHYICIFLKFCCALILTGEYSNVSNMGTRVHMKLIKQVY